MQTQGLLVRLHENRDYVNQTERSVIDYVLESPERSVGLSIHELASAAFVSASTVSRLCKRLDTGGYKGFQRSLVYDLAIEHDADRSEVAGLSPHDTTRQTASKVTRRSIEALAITERLNDVETIDDCVALMGAARVINLFGMGSSLLTARDLHYKLVRANVLCNVSEDWHEQLVRARNMGPEDLAIAFSYSGRTREVITCVEEARKQGAAAIAITRSGHDAEFVRLADKVLYVAATEPLFRSSAAASRISQLGVVDILFATFVNKNYERCAKAFGHTHIER